MLPEFLQDTEPDLLAEGEDGNVLVGVKLASEVHQGERWAKLSERSRENPNWRFELIAAEDLQHVASEPLSSEEITHQVNESGELYRTGHQAAALLTMWAAVEAALRRTARRYHVSVQDEGPGALIGGLYVEGVLDKSQYDLLAGIMTLRNRLAHGYRDAVVSSEDISRLAQIGTLLSA